MQYLEPMCFQICALHSYHIQIGIWSEEVNHYYVQKKIYLSLHGYKAISRSSEQ